MGWMGKDICVGSKKENKLQTTKAGKYDMDETGTRTPDRRPSFGVILTNTRKEQLPTPNAS